jgi:hypothetical protein
VLVGAPQFENGTIEFDVKPVGEGIPGIRFRQREDGTAEEFYLRPGPDCRASQDCIQYTPVSHGTIQWDLFPEHQKPAPLLESDWNHIKLVVSGRRLNVFVNDAPRPTLAVGHLESESAKGGLEVRGPAIFANLTVTPDAVEGLPPQALPDPTDSDRRYLRNWLVSPFTSLADGATPRFSEMPATPSSWSKIAAERHGLINLSRRYGSPTDKSLGAVAWLKTVVHSDRSQSKHVAIGWAREVWVFVDGKPVFSGSNLYYPPEARRTPDGRLSLENGAFDLPLKPGDNEIEVALSNNFPGGLRHYGWGVELRLDDRTGLTEATRPPS